MSKLSRVGMTNEGRNKKAAIVQACLEKLYPDPPIPLHHTNAFTMCIAVLLSAQTTDKAVNQATPALFALADNPADMVKLSPEKIQSLISRIGLSKTKSRNVWNLSKQLLEKHGGRLPRTMEELQELPGVGRKTASVVMSQVWGEPAFAVDTHIHRLAERWGLSNGKSVEQTERDLKTVFPRDKWSKLHLQMIYYGREHCPARNHDPLACQLCSQVGKISLRKAAKKRVSGK
ncbi:MAG: endonuclease III [Fibrobacteria bacterium]